jgi:predicted RecA/RadA family phage recombinase
MAALVKIVSQGDIIDYTPSGNVAAGDVVVQDVLIGVATQAICAAVKGGLMVQGIGLFPVNSIATPQIAGNAAYWNTISSLATTNATGTKRIGHFLATNAAAAATAEVRFTPFT